MTSQFLLQGLQHFPKVCTIKYIYIIGFQDKWPEREHQTEVQMLYYDNFGNEKLYRMTTEVLVQVTVVVV